MAEWETSLHETGNVFCSGSYWGENCRIVSYTRLAEGAEVFASPHALEHDLIPYSAVQKIEADSVLVLAPHPDDEALGCGGAILRHVDLGTPVKVVIATGGAEENQERACESRAAARVLDDTARRLLELWGSRSAV